MIVDFFDRHLRRLVQSLLFRLTRSMPQQTIDGITLIVVDPNRNSLADFFFQRTAKALDYIHRIAPKAYNSIHSNVAIVTLWHGDVREPYNRFQSALIVAPQTALTSDTACYATWLVYTSASVIPQTASEELTTFLGLLDPEDQVRVQRWLTQVEQRQRSAPEPDDEAVSDACRINR